MAKKYGQVAIAYDFDGTLAPGNMQEHSFIPGIGINKRQFWDEVKQLAKDHDMDEVLAYMLLMLKKADDTKFSKTRKAFNDHGKVIRLFEGVGDWFDRINSYGRTLNLSINHYIVSSGLREIIEGTDIAKKFKFIFASGFKYDQDNVAVWPALAVNYTTKTQYLFRINKGIINSYDNQKINEYTPEAERPVFFERMIYIGDGETDVPAMKMIRYQGGTAIAVYDQSKKSSKDRQSPKVITHKLLEHKRTSFVVPADYTENSELDKLIKKLLQVISLRADLVKINQRSEA